MRGDKIGYHPSKNFKIKKIDLSDNTTVAHTTGTNTQTLQPAAGFIYEIINIDVNIPVTNAGAAGNHSLTFRHDDGTDTYNVIIATAVGNTVITINPRIGISAGVSEYPGGSAQQYDYLSKGIIKLSNTEYMTIVYTNNSDNDQTGNRALLIWVKEYREKGGS